MYTQQGGSRHRATTCAQSHTNPGSRRAPSLPGRLSEPQDLPNADGNVELMSIVFCEEKGKRGELSAVLECPFQRIRRNNQGPLLVLLQETDTGWGALSTLKPRGGDREDMWTS